MWDPRSLWFEALTNGALGLSFLTLASALAYLAARVPYASVRRAAVVLGVFFAACGLTHLLDVVVLWAPAYRVDVVLRAIIALASLGTAALLLPLVVKASRHDGVPITKPANVRDRGASEEQVQARRTPASRTSERPLVLVVEANAKVSRSVCDALAEHYRTLSALDGRTGLELALTAKPDLVVSDVRRQSSGDRLVHAIRRHPELDAIPILLLTGRSDHATIAHLLREGAQDCVRKPFDPEELRARVHNLVSVKRAAEVLSRELAIKTHDVETLAAEMSHRKREIELALDDARRARDEVERANRARNDFLRLVSHELRTPLTAIRLLIERVSLDERLLTRDQAHAMSRMLAQTDRLHELIEGILEYARIESGRLETSPSRFDLAALATGAVDEVRTRAASKGLDLELEIESGPREVESDPRLVHLIIANLLGNAVKFTDDGHVALKVARRDGMIELAVSDTGPGIAREDRDRLFVPFESLQPIDQKHLAGVGLGLALVREVVNALGGRVGVESERGHGTTFTVEIPA